MMQVSVMHDPPISAQQPLLPVVQLQLVQLQRQAPQQVPQQQPVQTLNATQGSAFLSVVRAFHIH